jgi:uncharacterized protein YdaU (DUF1376 family)
MNKDTFWFPHDFEPTSDPKIAALIGQYGAAGYGFYWRIVEMMHSNTTHCIPEKQYIYLAIAKQMQADAKQIEAFINDCIDVFELFYRQDGCISCDRVLRNLNARMEISEKRKAAGSKGGTAKAKQNVAKAKQNVAKRSTGQNNTGKEKKENILLEKESKGDSEKDFENEVMAYLQKYPKPMLEKFILYWSERDGRGKMKWQLQKTWETGKRLATWHGNGFDKSAETESQKPKILPHWERPL